MTPGPDSGHLKDDDTRSWGDRAKEKKEEENPALIDDAEETADTSRRITAMQGEVDNKIFESNHGLEWLDVKNPEDTDDCLEPFKD